MVLGPSDFRDGEDVVWRLVWAAWRRIWKEDEITSVDALQASSWAKSTMGTYCTHFRKMALWVGYTPTSELEQAACRYIFQLWGLGYSGSSLKVAVSAFRALEDMGWLPAFVSRRVWRCAKWAPTEPALRPYAGLDDLRNFALACTERPQWTVYGMAVLAFTCLLRVGEAAPLRRGGSRCRGLAFRTVKVAPRIVRRRLGKYAQEWLGWLDATGKDIDLQGGEVRTAGNAWEALFAHWLRLSVGPCRVKRLQQFLGRAQWICRPGSGHSPHLSGVWAHVLWAPPRLPFTPVRLLKSMCVACVLARRQWSVVSLPRVVKRSPLVVYVDAALDAGEYRLGLFSMDVGSRSVVPAEQPPNQQCAEAAALLWGLKLILNVGVREAHLFGDNAAALVQFLRCKAKVGRKFQQSILKRFRYLWASCPGFTVYMHWVRGSHNPADPISRLSDNFNGDLGLAREVAARRVGDLWAFPDRRTVFLWTLGVPMGPFVLPHSWRAGLWSPGGGEGGAEFHEVFLQYRLEESVGAMT